MPYDIVKFPDGYRVRTKSGKYLSDKPLTLTEAEKQQSAVGISRSAKGGSKGVHIPYRDFVKEHKNLLGVLMRPTKAKLTNEINDQHAELKKVLLKGGALPTNDTIAGQMAEDSYKPQGTANIGGFTLVYNTPTIKAYKQGNNIVIAVRGTVPSDKVDLGADASIAINNLNNTPRYKTDASIVNAIRQQYPSDRFFGVGHSLGGAIVDNLIQDGLIEEAVSFNPAVESKFYNNTKNQRISHKDDPLYRLMTKNARNVRVIQTPLKKDPLPIPKVGISWLDEGLQKVAQKFNPFGYFQDKLKAHSVGSIFGRGSCGKPYGNCGCSGAFKEQLEGDKYSCAKYLSDARKKASKAGLKKADTLDFANDPTHKLRITAPDGSIRMFGRVEYGDHLIWSHLEALGKIPKGTANKKRSVFQKSHRAIKGDWQDDPYSPNNLALNILW